MFVVSVALELIVSGIFKLKVFAASSVTVPLLITTPPVAAKVEIHSAPDVMVALYFKVADEPYVGAAETLLAPSIERIPFTVIPVVVFVPDAPERVRFVYVAALTVCVVPEYFTVEPLPFRVIVLVPVPDILKDVDPAISRVPVCAPLARVKVETLFAVPFIVTTLPLTLIVPD